MPRRRLTHHTGPRLFSSVSGALAQLDGDRHLRVHMGPSFIGIEKSDRDPRRLEMITSYDKFLYDAPVTP